MIPVCRAAACLVMTKLTPSGAGANRGAEIRIRTRQRVSSAEEAGLLAPRLRPAERATDQNGAQVAGLHGGSHVALLPAVGEAC